MGVYGAVYGAGGGAYLLVYVGGAVGPVPPTRIVHITWSDAPPAVVWSDAGPTITWR